MSEKEPSELYKIASKYWIERQLALAQLCGQFWQSEYAKFHAAHQFDASPVLIVVNIDSGFADRFAGAVSALYWAILTRRVFYFVTPENVVPFSSSFHSLWIQPTSFRDLRPFDAANVFFQGEEARWYDESFCYQQRLDYFRALNSSLAFFTQSAKRADQIFLHQNLRETFAEHQRLFFSSNRGRSYRLVKENPFHSQELQLMGLTPRNAFLCGFDFLFQPRHDILTLAAPLIGAMMEYDIKIAIGIRMGDSFITGHDNGDIRNYESYFRCAEHIEAAAKENNPQLRSVWFVRGESTKLKLDAKAKYEQSDRFILIDHFRPQHSQFLKDLSEKEAALTTVAALMYSFAAADYFIISRNSGFTLQSAWLSTALNPQIFSDTCQIRSLDEWASDWSGI